MKVPKRRRIQKKNIACILAEKTSLYRGLQAQLFWFI